MTSERFHEYVERFVELLRLLAPRDKGILAFDAIKAEWHGDREAEIYIDGDGKDGIAPYAPFTIEPWVAEKWNGAPNPNEGWWQDAIAEIIEELNAEFGGRTSEDS